jgi:hypothetical protein
LPGKQKCDLGLFWVAKQLENRGARLIYWAVHRYWVTAVFCLGVSGYAAEPVRYAPPAGIGVPAGVRAELEAGLSNLGTHIDDLRMRAKRNPSLSNLLADVEVFHKAVDWALHYGEFYRSNEFSMARGLLRQGVDRAIALKHSEAPWLGATGLVVRGYVSKIDGSVQPYGLIVPASYMAASGRPHRLDVWLHGRDDHLTELKFLSDRQRSYGEFAPANAFVLHPYGRYCNAFKFAGEMDVFEAMEHVRRNYFIDERRIAIRGFSMGGAGCWHLAVHHPDQWAAAAPGAGFAETAIYTKAFSKNPPPWYEQTLWHLYDSADYALNLFNCPAIAYSGEIDPQKQAADVMAAAMKASGLDLVHVIGPNTPHRYEPRAKVEVASKVDALVEKGNNPWPSHVKFATWSLWYSKCDWVTVERLEKHWERAVVDASAEQRNRCVVSTTNVVELSLRLRGARTGEPSRVDIDGQTILAKGADLRGIRTIRLAKTGHHAEWAEVSRRKRSPLAKRPGLQGPIDDAFMDSFLIVRPTGKPMHLNTATWIQEALMRATNEWRSQFRGFAQVKDDADVTPADIASHNLVLWGDPKSNKLLGKIANRLPLRWTTSTIRLTGKSYDSSKAVPILIYPNPLNPERYIVLNSGFTFADRGGASNAQQTPKLPDWAVLELDGNGRRAASSYSGTPVLDAGFFNEAWQVAEK